MKQVSYYAVIDNDLDVNNTHVYTASIDKKGCEEFIDKILLNQNINHYKSWCEMRQLDYKNSNSWKSYKEASELSSLFKIIKIKCPLNNLLALFRIYTGYKPIGCSYETNIEKDVK